MRCHRLGGSMEDWEEFFCCREAGETAYGRFLRVSGVCRNCRQMVLSGIDSSASSVAMRVSERMEDIRLEVQFLRLPCPLSDDTGVGSIYLAGFTVRDGRPSGTSLSRAPCARLPSRRTGSGSHSRRSRCSRWRWPTGICSGPPA